jgi:hypothetical protein
MIYDPKNAKPRRSGRGFARLLWSAFAFFRYRIGPAGANVCLPFLPLALDGARNSAALLWGGLQ